MKTLIYILKRYRFFIVMLIILAFIYLFNESIFLNSITSAASSVKQMLTVLPPIMILLGLIDVWIPRETLIKYMGNNSGLTGIFLAIAIGSIGAGPMYAAFPFTAVLINKGAKFSNVILFMNAWCVTKISTLLFEISSLGYKFTLVRLLIDIPGIILMSLLINKLMTKSDLDKIYLEN